MLAIFQNHHHLHHYLAVIPPLVCLMLVTGYIAMTISYRNPTPKPISQKAQPANSKSKLNSTYSPSAQTTQEAQKTYHDSQYGISFSYPSSALFITPDSEQAQNMVSFLGEQSHQAGGILLQDKSVFSYAVDSSLSNQSECYQNFVSTQTINNNNYQKSTISSRTVYRLYLNNTCYEFVNFSADSTEKETLNQILASVSFN